MALGNEAPDAALLLEGTPVAADAPAINPLSVSSANDILGFRILRPLGVVRGVTVRSRNVGAQLGAGLKALVGGELKQMTTLCEGAREQAVRRMLEEAAERGANGVLAVRYDTNSIAPGITEVIAYGLAVTDGGVPMGGAAGSGTSAGEGIQRGCVCTSNELPRYTMHRSLGIVQGLTVRSRNVFATMGAGFKSLVGGEIKTFTKMCEDARQEAYVRMLAEAVERGADGVLAMRYDTNEVAEGVTEVLAYGTAVASTTSGEPGAPPLDGGLAPHMVTTTSILPGLSAPHSLGVVRGLTVRSSNAIANLGAGLKSIAGGEIRTWSSLCSATRREAFDRMLEEARLRGARGIVAMRYESNEVQDGMVEVIAYGTAVSSEPGPDQPPSAEGGIMPHRVSTDLEIPGYRVRCSLGIARGISVQSCHLIRNIGAGLKSIVGGEIRNFSAMCESAREEAYARMLQHAAEMGATGIAAMRFESNDLQPGVIEVVAYGTAVSDGDWLPRPATPSPGTHGGAFVCTTNEAFGHSTERSLGLVRGVTVRSRNIGASIGAGLKAAFVGGEVRQWTRLCEDAREQAFERLLQEAAERGARGVVAIRYETNEISPGITEVLAFGTAVA